MVSSYYELYFPFVLQIGIAIALAVGMVGTSWFIGQHVKNKVKDMPYECGMVPVGSAKERFSVQFYLVAMVFILFDIEAIFLYPWVTVNRDLLGPNSGLWIFWEMAVFVALVLCGFFYILKKGVLDWSKNALRDDRAARTEEVIRKYAA